MAGRSARGGETQTSRATAIIAKQLAMNAQTLAALQQSGLKPDTSVQLDFTFVAPDRGAGAALKSHLEQNDCLDVELRKRSLASSQRRSTWSRKSQPTTVDAETSSVGVAGWTSKALVATATSHGWGPVSHARRHAPNKRIKLSRQRVAARRGRGARSLSAVR